jgi:hypothetical protein
MADDARGESADDARGESADDARGQQLIAECHVKMMIACTLDLL